MAIVAPPANHAEFETRHVSVQDVVVAAPCVVRARPVEDKRGVVGRRQIIVKGYVIAVVVDKTHALGRIPDGRRDIAVDGGKNLTVRKPDTERTLTAH